MEGPPKIETENEEVNDDQVVEALKTHGIENPEAKELLLKWIDQEHSKVDSLGEDSAQAKAECEIRIALMYDKAGYKEAALEELEASRLEAHNRGDEQLYNEIMDHMDRIEIELSK